MQVDGEVLLEHAGRMALELRFKDIEIARLERQVADLTAQVAELASQSRPQPD